RLVNLRLRCAFRHAEEPCDFVVLESFDVVQYERGAAALGESSDCALEVDTAHRRGAARNRRRRCDRWQPRRPPRGPPPRRGGLCPESFSPAGPGESPGNDSPPADRTTFP